MLLAAKIQKQKDAEADAEATTSTTLSPPGAKAKTEPVDSYAADSRPADTSEASLVGHNSSKHLEEPCVHSLAQELADAERRQLQSISDRIDECMMRAARMEQHWDTSVQTILKLLTPVKNTEHMSYV